LLKSKQKLRTKKLLKITEAGNRHNVKRLVKREGYGVRDCCKCKGQGEAQVTKQQARGGYSQKGSST